LDKALKIFVSGNEIRLGVDLDDGTHRAVGRNPDQALRGDPPGLLRGRGQTFLSQPIYGGFDIAATVAERPLAVHHPRAGLLA
jgi:hypothetical protein